MRSGKAWAVLALLVALGLPGAGQAQVFTPTFAGPRLQSDFGVYLVDWDPGDFGIEGIFRQSYGGYDAGFRLGVIDAGDVALSLGAELHNPLILGIEPLEAAFTAGVQGVVGDVDGLGVQAGLSVGGAFVPGNFIVIPYLHPRIALLNDIGLRDEYDVEVLADLGVDILFESGLRLQFAAGLDDVGADWGIGLAWR